MKLPNVLNNILVVQNEPKNDLLFTAPSQLKLPAINLNKQRVYHQVSNLSRKSSSSTSNFPNQNQYGSICQSQNFQTLVLPPESKYLKISNEIKIQNEELQKQKQIVEQLYLSQQTILDNLQILQRNSNKFVLLCKKLYQK
ncbi:Hypothetical_protein [Hexamita inflata]|uniref:Hypothetical_protein n=1 Tax=Hexamita inflata TaxID=28002 RepID=A0AA86U6U7_9EUKA|nr:Hypothetical protein HINF_LOCUS30974 [Hexamita inflata]